MANEFVAKNGLIAQNNSIVTGSLIVTNGITGSLFGTSSQAVSASYTATSSYGFNAVSASYAYTASSAIRASASLVATSASYAFTASSAISASNADLLDGFHASYFADTGSNNFTGSQNISGSVGVTGSINVVGSITATGTLTAQTLVVTTVSSSVVYSSGSNIFGNSTTNTQTMTGSLNVSGSATIIGRVTATDLTGSLFGTASWATNFLTSSVTSASYAFTASSAVSSSYAFTASSAINASASLIAVSASYSFTASSAIRAFSASNASTASYVNPLNQLVTITGSIILNQTVGATHSIYNPNDGIGLVLRGKGNAQTADLRIVANGGGWVDNKTTAYFQITSSAGNYVTFMGGTYGADAPFDRFQINSKYTSFTNFGYGLTPVPVHLVEIVNSGSNVSPLAVIGTSAQTVNYLNVHASGSATGSTFSITKDGVVTIGTTTSSTEANLFLGGLTANEGGQLVLQPGLSFTSGAMFDNYQDRLRILRGTAINSNAEIAWFNLTTKQFALPAYNSSTAFTGTSVANLAVDSSGNVITVAAAAGSGFPYSGSAQITGSLGVTGSFSVTAGLGSNVFSSNADTLLITGSLIITGSASITGSLSVSGSITGSLFGTSSWAQNAVTSSYALTASYVASIANLSTSQIATGSVTASVGQSTSSFQIVSGSTNLMYVSSSGFVGFGHTAPKGKIHATGSSIAIIGDANDNFFGNYTAGDYVDVGNLGTIGTVYFDARGTSTNVDAAYRTKGAGDHIWSYAAGAVEIMRTDAGNLGLGVINPSARLHISGSGSGSLMRISSHVSSSIFYVSGSGNIGFGTTTPEFKLDISGSGQARIGSAELGNWPAVTNYAFFGHEKLDHTTQGNYALLQDSGGNTYINAATGKFVALRINNNTRATIEDTKFTFTGSLLFSGSMVVTGSITGSLSGSVTGSLFGTSSWSQNALTASYAMGGSANAILYQTASAATTWSFNHFLQTQYPVFTIYDSSNNIIIPQRVFAQDTSSALIYFSTPTTGIAVASKGGYSASVVTSATTANTAITASYALLALSASNAPGFTFTFSQSLAAVTWSINHNMNTRTPLVQVYDINYNQLVPNQVVSVTQNLTEVRFDYGQNGYAVLSSGMAPYVTGSTSLLNQTTPAVTWSFAHNLNSKYVNFQVYDSTDYTIIPSNIKAIDTNNAEIHLAYPMTGTAVANFSGINGQMNAQTASYAYSSSFVFPLRQNLLVTGSLSVSGSMTAISGSFSVSGSETINGYTILTRVSQSLNYADDVAAAAGGVPLGGLYRNGNFILIRLS